jgi:hypothetical protein
MEVSLGVASSSLYGSQLIVHDRLPENVEAMFLWVVMVWIRDKK